MEAETLTIAASPSTSFQSEEEHTEPRGEELTNISIIKTVEDGVNKSDRPKRGRGRPRKVASRIQTRVSTRLKTCPKVISYDISKTKSMWSNQDKMMFLKGLEELGCEDLVGLQTYLPHKSENDIANQIRMWKAFAIAELQKKMATQKKRSDAATVNAVSKLDEWLKLFDELSEMSDTKESPNPLADVFLLISEYAKFPPPSECGGVDYRAMYRYVHCMINGIPYYGVNPETARAINQSISKMLTKLREGKVVQNLQPHLRNLDAIVKPGIRTYGRPPKKVTSSTNNSNSTAILNVPNMNPLKIPPHILAKPEVEDEFDLYSSDDD